MTVDISTTIVRWTMRTNDDHNDDNNQKCEWQFEQIRNSASNIVNEMPVKCKFTILWHGNIKVFEVANMLKTCIRENSEKCMNVWNLSHHWVIKF